MARSHTQCGCGAPPEPGFQPAFGALGDIRILTDARVAVELGAGVSLRNSLNLRYDSEPPDDTEGLDVTFRSGLALTF